MTPISFERYNFVSIEELRNLLYLQLSCSQRWTGPFKIKKMCTAHVLICGCQADMHATLIYLKQECDYKNVCLRNYPQMLKTVA